MIYTHLGCGARRTASFDLPVGKNGQLQVGVRLTAPELTARNIFFFFFSSSPPAEEKEFIESLNDKLNSGVVRGTAAFYKNAW
jgi:hypothetical protein